MPPATRIQFVKRLSVPERNELEWNTLARQQWKETLGYVVYCACGGKSERVVLNF